MMVQKKGTTNGPQPVVETCGLRISGSEESLFNFNGLAKPATSKLPNSPKRLKHPW